MNIQSKQISLTLVSVQLDSKKVTNAILDQIPRLDISYLFVDNDGDYSHRNDIAPVCRFSLHHFLNSQIRNYKTMRYSPDQIERLIDLRTSHDEAFLFTYQGELYCDTYSEITGTVEYGNRHHKLEKKVLEIDSEIEKLSKIIDLYTQGLEPINIILKCHSIFSPLPRLRRRKTKSSGLVDWGNDILGFDATPEQEAAHELKIITQEHGSWDQYIKQLKLAEATDKKTKNHYEIDLRSYETSVATLIRHIKDAPFAVFGL